MALVAINVLIFAAMLAHGAGLWHSPNQIQLSWGAGFGPATKDGEWWRLGTAMFLHFGILHLSLNMWALWDCGRLVERLYGSARFIAVFLGSGLAGNLLSLSVHGESAVSGGASGAIFGIYGALLVWLWHNRQQIHPTEFRWLFGGAAFFSAATIGFGLLNPGMDNAAHIGGLVSGMLIGNSLTMPGGAAKKPLRLLNAFIFLTAVAGIALNMPAPSYRWRDEVRAREEVRQFIATDRQISEQWQEILRMSRQDNVSFEELAGRIDSDISLGYLKSFEQLSSLDTDPVAPTTTTLEFLKQYALIRKEAAHELAEGLRLNDRQRIQEALEMARRAPYDARQLKPPPVSDR